MGDYDVHVERGQFHGERGQARFIALGKAKFETLVLSLDVAEVAKPLPKISGTPLRPLSGVARLEIADPEDTFGRLRDRRERPCPRTNEEADDLASSGTR